MIPPQTAESSLVEIHAQIQEAARTFDWSEVGRCAESFAQKLWSQNRFDESTTTAALELLLGNRQYDAVMRIADAALTIAPTDRRLLRFYAQALIDQGRVAPALRIYEAIASAPDATAQDRSEGRGGIGRCYKQLFLSASDPDRRAEFLKCTVSAYNEIYNAHRSPWHGINLVALLARAARDGVVIAGQDRPADPPARIAADVLKSVAEQHDPWNAATACEANIALGHLDEALIQARLLVSHPQTRTFMIASLLRQLQQVWQLAPDSPLGVRLLALLRAELVRKEGGAVVLTSDELTSAGLDELKQLADRTSDAAAELEKVFGAERFQTLQWWNNGLLCCRAVVRIDDLNGVGRGTGFLVDGTALHASFPRHVIITNGHVVPESIEQNDAVVAFRGLDADTSAEKFTIRKLWWYSPSARPALDTTVIELSGVPSGIEPIPLARTLPSFTQDSRAYIIGHPRGYDQPQFSIQDNKLLDHNDTYLHYRAPTEGGSSGSPVFHSQWKVIGLHHSGSLTMSRLTGTGTYPANEALRIDAIRHAIDTNPAGSPVPVR